MNEDLFARLSRRYLALDIHKHYSVVAGVNFDGKVIVEPVRVGGFFNLRGLFLRNPANKARKPHTLLVKALSQQAQLLETPVY